jgi:hypothetical protein
VILLKKIVFFFGKEARGVPGPACKNHSPAFLLSCLKKTAGPSFSIKGDYLIKG